MFSCQFAFSFISTANDRNQPFPANVFETELSVICPQSEIFSIFPQTRFPSVPSVLLQLYKLYIGSTPASKVVL